ncbi:hypothetical protein EYF80_040105 [Liparis tanakae]|uniref:Uncharacterized protein n=1 Tax=Liparis tanakae TaxID=230148 RepID=A0A4Z2G940_9TELE|nr:hypothetical protein EYF80_040105 [Liparis tanakae]
MEVERRSGQSVNRAMAGTGDGLPIASSLTLVCSARPAVSLLRTQPTVTPPSRRPSWGASPLIISSWLKYPDPALAHQVNTLAWWWPKRKDQNTTKSFFPIQ